MSGVATVLNLDISGVGIRLQGPDQEMLDRFRAAWSPWVGLVAGDPVLSLEFQVAGDPPRDQSALKKVLHTARRGNRITITTGEGHVVLGPDGRAAATVLQGEGRFRFYGLQNLLLAALARVLPAHGLALVHGAGVLIEGTAVALVGPEGAGKSTWSRIAAESGAEVLSEDLLLLGLDQGRPAALGSPFRDGGKGPGRWPLGMLLSARHGSPAELLPCSRLAMTALISANLPYSGDRAGEDGVLTELLDTLLAELPCRTLVFPPDGTFMPVLRRALSEKATE